jgi:uncharacterized cupredoxin-like copper-binding protein
MGGLDNRIVFSFSIDKYAVSARGTRLTTGRSAAAEQHTPRWLLYALTALAALCTGAILVARIPQHGAAAALSAETLAGLPALTSNQLKFDQADLRVKTGETVALRLDNADSMPHSFDLDAFNVHVAMQSGKPSLALFKATKAGTYTFYCSIPGHREAAWSAR